ncbi:MULTISPECIES: hypothetical protein [unclassified Nostoc]|jgi:hypothetical protein|nr:MULTISPECIES: hypothetical protein [unclassified Nostoc]
MRLQYSPWHEITLDKIIQVDNLLISWQTVFYTVLALLADSQES